MASFVVFREPRATSEPFQCMFTTTTTATTSSVQNEPPRGCEAGAKNRDSTGGRGGWHPSGVPKGLWLNPWRGQYDSLCPEHWAETKKTRLGDSSEMSFAAPSSGGGAHRLSSGCSNNNNSSSRSTSSSALTNSSTTATSSTNSNCNSNNKHLLHSSSSSSSSSSNASGIMARPAEEVDIGAGCRGRSGHNTYGKGKKRSREEASSKWPPAAADALATIRTVYGPTDDSDLPPVLPHRGQAQKEGHADATPTAAAAAAAAAATAAGVEEATLAARRILTGMRTGMPCPKQDGGLRTMASNSDGDEASCEWGKLCMDRAPYFALGSSEVRARRHKRRAAPGWALVWTDEAKHLAMEEFMFEGDVVFVVPEVFFRSELMSDRRFQVRSETGAVTGVRMMCPTCLNNDYTGCLFGWGQPRSVHTVSGKNLFVVARRYGCLNPLCQSVKDAVVKKLSNPAVLPGVAAELRQLGLSEAVIQQIKAGEFGGVHPSTVKRVLSKGASFNIVEKRYMELLPLKVQGKFMFDLYGKGGAEHLLLDKTLCPGKAVAALYRDLKQAYDFEQMRKLEEYEFFKKEEGGTWPVLKPFEADSAFSAPTQKEVQKYCNDRFLEVRPLLQRHLCNISPGKSLALEMAFTAAPEGTGEENRRIAFAVGTLGHIVSYAALASDSTSHLLPLLARLKWRLQRLGTEKVLEAIYRNTCCEGLAETKDHFFTKVFSGVSRAPYSDNSCMAQTLMAATRTSHPLHEEFAREVAACFAEKHGPDVARVARHLVSDRGFLAGPALKAAHSSTYERNVRIKIRPQQECLTRLRKIREMYKAASEDCVRQGELGLFLERDGETPSTEETFEKVAACVAKGCLHGGSGDQDAYTRDGVCPKTQLPVMHRTEGTGKYEAGNSPLLEQFASQAAMLGGEILSERELALFVFFYNVRVDQVRGICDADFFGGRFWREELLKRICGGARGPCAGGGQCIPPELIAGDDGPMGFDYLEFYKRGHREQVAMAFGIDLKSLDEGSPPAQSQAPASQGEPGGGGRAQGSSNMDVCEAAAKTRTRSSRSGPSVATENAGVGGPGATTGSSGGAIAGADVKVELTFARETDGATSGTGRGEAVVV